VIDIILSQRIK